MSQERFYLDYNATSPLSPLVLDFLRGGDLLFANPASQHSDGKNARKIINESRLNLFETFGKNSKDTKLFFHSGATEAISTFAYSFAEITRRGSKKLLVCVSNLDHPCVYGLRERYFGDHVTFFELKRDENLKYSHSENYESLKTKKNENPDLVILYHHLWVHNETGQVDALSNLREFKNIPDLFIHVDAVQAPGKISEWRDLSEGDIWSFSAHKFGALKGIGFTFFKSTVEFHSFIQGGGQQFSLRSGTENALGIKTIDLALKDLKLINIEKNKSQRDLLLTFLEKELLGIGEILSHGAMASNTIYFYLNNLSSDIALALFDINGLEISAGSACSSGAAKDSLILLHKGLSSVAKNGLRISLPFEMSEEMLEIIKTKLSQILFKLKS